MLNITGSQCVYIIIHTGSLVPLLVWFLVYNTQLIRMEWEDEGMIELTVSGSKVLAISLFSPLPQIPIS